MFESKSERGILIKEEYAKFLQEYYWEDFFTATFRRPRHEPYYADKHIWSELKNYNVTRAFIGIEPFQSGDLHAHGMISGNISGWRPEMKLTWDIWEGLFNRFGRAKVEACNSAERVSEYCAKYILKQQSRACDYYYFHGDKFSWAIGKI